MINFIKGIFVGIFNIIPGLSGSALLIILNLYEKCIDAISNIIKKPRENILFLFPIGIGILLGTFLFSKIILLLLENYPTQTFIVFTGFLLGTIPHLFKEATKKGFKDSYIIPFLFTLSLGIIMLFFDTEDISYQINYDFLSSQVFPQLFYFHYLIYMESISIAFLLLIYLFLFQQLLLYY